MTRQGGELEAQVAVMEGDDLIKKFRNGKPQRLRDRSQLSTKRDRRHHLRDLPSKNFIAVFQVLGIDKISYFLRPGVRESNGCKGGLQQERTSV